MTRLDAELRRLVDDGVLTDDQAHRIQEAARSDTDDRPGGSVLTEVLGYVGGVLLLGAVALLVIVNWNEMVTGQRIAVTAGSAVLLLGAAAVLARVPGRDQLASALAALGAGVAGFATYVVIEDTPGRLAGVVVAVVVSLLGLWLVSGPPLVASLAAALATGVFVVVFDVIEGNGERSDSAGLAGAGFVLVAAVLAAVGLVRHRTTSWSLAGTAVFASALCWLVQDGTSGVALAVSTAGAAALLTAYAKLRQAAYLIVACGTLLVAWPTALYQITDNVAAVALTLLIASGILVSTVVLLSRRRHRTGATA
jgi:Predicted membrane protein (DUF2157)